MTLEEEFEKETGYEPYLENDLRPIVPRDYYVEWLENKIEKLLDTMT